MDLLKDITPPIIYKIAKHFKNKPPKSQPKSIITGKELIESKGENVKGIFMHIHKCAGTSLIQVFENYPEIISCVGRPGNFPKRTGRELIPDSIWNESLKFTFVRNPYARIVSAYLMFTSGPKWSNLFPNFEEFAIYLKWSDIHNHKVYKEIDIDEYGKQLDNILHHCSSFSNDKYKLNEMDFVGKIENMEEDILKIGALLHIKIENLPHHNRRNKEYSYRDYYNDNSKKIISEIYADDIKKYGYEF